MEIKQKIHSFTDLETWRKAHALVVGIYLCTKKYPKDEQFGIINQMRRAAVSITSNIAEGFSRNSPKEKAQFYAIAQGSLTELQNQLLISRDVGYLTSLEHKEIESQLVTVHKLINGLSKYVRTLFVFLLFFIPYTLYFIPNTIHAAARLSMPPNYLIANSSGLVGYWTLDGKDTNWMSNTTNDLSGNNHTGTMTNMSTTTSPAPGKLGQALNFDGVNDYVSVGNVSASLQSVSFWTKAATTTVVGKLLDLNGTASIENISGTITANNFTSPTIYVDGVVSSTVNDTNWHHVVITTGTAINASAVDIGRVAGTTYGGSLDDVRMYSRVLSASEISFLSRAGQAKIKSSGTTRINVSPTNVLTSGLVGYWTFDGKDTPWTSATAATTLDKSGNSNTGTLTNMLQSTSPAVGKLGQALSFDGVDDYVSVNASAAIPTFDATSTGSSQTTTLTKSHTVGTGTNRLLVVIVYQAGNDPGDVSGITYNNVALTQSGERLFSTRLRIQIWYLVNPSSGTNNAVVSITNPGAGRNGAAILSYTGVDQTTPLGTFASAQSSAAGTAISVGVTSATGELVVDGAAQEPDASAIFTVGAGQTQRVSFLAGDPSPAMRSGSSEEAGAATVTMSWTSNVSQHWIAAGVPLKPASASGSVSSNTQSISFWMKNATSTTQKIIDLNGTATITSSSGTISANSFTSPTIYVDGVVSSTVNDTAWHHVVITTGTAINASAVDIGRVGTTYYGGSLDDVRMYSRVLSAGEILQLYNISK